jgi:hypothetical protein
LRRLSALLALAGILMTCGRADHAGRRLTRAGTLLLAVLLSAACAGGPLGADATQLPGDRPGGSSTPEACPGALLEGELIADDATGFLVRHAEGFVTAVIWPDGYEVRDREVRELVGPGGQVVAQEGDSVSLGGGMIGADTAFAVCGEFTVTRRD